MAKVFSRKTFTRKGLEAETTAYLAQLATLPSAGWINNLNILIKTLKADGNWAELDRLWIFATEIQAHARVSLVNPSSTQITEVNSPTWTIRQGYTGNGGNMYLNTNIAANALTKYIQDSGSIGVYSRTLAVSGGSEMGYNKTTVTAAISEVACRFTGDLLYISINDGTLLETSVANTNGTGMFSAQRTSATNQEGWRNGIRLSSGNRASAVPQALNFFILALNTNSSPNSFSSKQISMAYVGSGAINQPKFYYAIQNFLQSQNAAIL